MEKNGVRVMGVLNVTPDSFYDGGQCVDVNTAVDRALRMIESGATIIDIGGESTRPGAKEVGVDEELHRVIPVVEALKDIDGITLSIDTSKPRVMREAIDAGAHMINDVLALRQPGAIAVASDLAVPVCLMHMQGLPDNMQAQPKYENVLSEVDRFLKERVDACLAGGIKAENIILDPGFGFGKTLSHNMSLMKHLAKIVSIGYPVLIGVSRKSMLDAILSVDVEGRLVGSLALATLAIAQGASIVRVHDVEETVQVVKVCHAVMSAA